MNFDQDRFRYYRYNRKRREIKAEPTGEERGQASPEKPKTKPEPITPAKTKEPGAGPDLHHGS